MTGATETIGGWGRFPTVEAEVVHARDLADVQEAVRGGGLLPRGLGRSYGDSSLADRVVDLTALDAFIGFDEETGIVTVEAGTSLADVLATLLPRGWFLPVTPGTAFVTVGGAVASDVHGKNHHKVGSFCDHVRSLDLLLASGEVVTTSPEQHPELFRATCGGMGLTGVIVRATFQMLAVRSRKVDETVVKARCLDEALEVFSGNREATYSVAWIDLVATGRSLGRSLVMLGEHADDGDLTSAPGTPLATVPFDLPAGLLNKLTVKAFNTAYYHRVRGRVTQHRVDLQPYFYPLDKAEEWNRLYGSQGLIQYQFAIPFAGGAEVLTDIVRRVSAAGLASPLAVLKEFGPGNDNYLSFPVEGLTLALDFKATPEALRLADELDRCVLDAGGRLYLTKDSRMSADTFHACYPGIEEFESIRQKYGAAGFFTSTQSQRLGLA